VSNTERNAEIKRLRHKGLTFAQIAARLHITRNTVAGVLSRTGTIAIKPPRPIQRAARPQATASKPTPVPASEPVPLGERVDGCQWLHGEASERNFCGHGQRKASAFCPYHHARCFTYAPEKFTNKRYLRAA
jgi:hypothetical protein